MRPVIFPVLFFLALSACTQEIQVKENHAVSGIVPVDTTQMRMIMGQTVYVPVYAKLPIGKSEKLDLRTILSVRNTSEKEALVISKADYFDTEGQLVKSFVESPVKVEKMATMEIELSTSQPRGGSGGNFVVIWASDKKVSKPVIEAVMYGTQGPHSFSFVSRGEEIEAH